MKNIAIVLAGGSGSRFGADLPKQFLPLEGKTVVEHSIDAFEAAEAIDEIAAVVHPDHIERMKAIADRRSWGKLRHIIPGGKERHESSLNAVRLYAESGEEVNLILHDAARPWISQDIIARVASALTSHEAVSVGIRSTDTLWHCTSGESPQITHIPPRDGMWRAQTPQAFRLSVLAKAYSEAVKNPDFKPTDDCGVVLTYCPATSIYVVEGSEQNRKITFSEDLR